MSVPQDPRARRRQETHRRIYTTAMRLFQERGYDQVPVAQIAAAARVSVPTFYDHFPSKEHIVLPMPQAGEIEQVLTAQPASLLLGERVRSAMLAWLAAVQGPDRDELLERWRIMVTTPGCAPARPRSSGRPPNWCSTWWRGRTTTPSRWSRPWW